MTAYDYFFPSKKKKNIYCFCIAKNLIVMQLSFHYQSLVFAFFYWKRNFELLWQPLWLLEISYLKMMVSLISSYVGILVRSSFSILSTTGWEKVSHEIYVSRTYRSHVCGTDISLKHRSHETVSYKKKNSLRLDLLKKKKSIIGWIKLWIFSKIGGLLNKLILKKFTKQSPISFLLWNPTPLSI